MTTMTNTSIKKWIYPRLFCKATVATTIICCRHLFYRYVIDHGCYDNDGACVALNNPDRHIKHKSTCVHTDLSPCVSIDSCFSEYLRLFTKFYVKRSYIHRCGQFIYLFFVLYPENSFKKREKEKTVEGGNWYRTENLKFGIYYSLSHNRKKFCTLILVLPLIHN